MLYTWAAIITEKGLVECCGMFLFYIFKLRRSSLLTCIFRSILSRKNPIPR